MTKTEHRARITWSPALEQQGLPTIHESIDPAWLPSARSEGWSLKYRFATPPNEQGNPSEAQVSFLMDNAPHDQLRPGAKLLLFEKWTGERIVVEILD